MAEYYINLKYNKTFTSVQQERSDILRCAAQLIKSEIRDMTCDNTYYPSSTEVTANWIPESLREFLSFFTNSHVKMESIGQAVVKLSSSNFIPPVLFALSIEVDSLFGSRWLVDELFKLGFGVSYNKVTRFKQACVTENDNLIDVFEISNDESFTQFIADNVDHNVATLLHWMEMEHSMEWAS